MEKQEIVEKCAEAAHEMNRLFCEAHGDFLQDNWGNAPAWQRESAIRGVDIALSGATPFDQHNAWCKDKLENGWKFGPVKDPDKKEHPCLVDYNKLPKHQKLKDYLFITTVTCMAAVLRETIP
jgi:hypothetical protein